MRRSLVSSSDSSSDRKTDSLFRRRRLTTGDLETLSGVQDRDLESFTECLGDNDGLSPDTAMLDTAGADRF